MHTTNFNAARESDTKMIYSSPKQNRMNTKSPRFTSLWVELKLPKEEVTMKICKSRQILILGYELLK